ncbi:hypothetical protein IMSAGC009_02744 [Lachnospiraceae bacterium]|jgi:hypothetical protein|nr:hypothetical protein IMSAGC009_02744 [Lachnospiraceae bacterium]
MIDRIYILMISLVQKMFYYTKISKKETFIWEEEKANKK